jgi:hypothetical protein|tara:strand:+ start:1398 stop:1667 length:270 start_codon:yes stop_codon:yes gene_type:complete
MGKLTVAETKALQDEGILSKASVKEMQDKGLVSSRARNEKRVVKTASGTYVTPQFYFQGLNGADYSVDMTSLKDEVANLINKYTKIITK